MACLGIGLLTGCKEPTPEVGEVPVVKVGNRALRTGELPQIYHQAIREAKVKLGAGATAKFPDFKKAQHREEGGKQIFTGQFEVSKDGGKSWKTGIFKFGMVLDPKTDVWMADDMMLGYQD